MYLFTCCCSFHSHAESLDEAQSRAAIQPRSSLFQLHAGTRTTPHVHARSVGNSFQRTVAKPNSESRLGDVTDYFAY